MREAFARELLEEWTPDDERRQTVVERTIGLKLGKVLGCGAFGCVFSTSDPKWVAKVTEDGKEATAAHALQAGLVKSLALPKVKDVLTFSREKCYRPPKLKRCGAAQYFLLVRENLDDLPEELAAKWERCRNTYRMDSKDRVPTTRLNRYKGCGMAELDPAIVTLLRRCDQLVHGMGSKGGVRATMDDVSASNLGVRKGGELVMRDLNFHWYGQQAPFLDHLGALGDSATVEERFTRLVCRKQGEVCEAARRDHHIAAALLYAAAQAPEEMRQFIEQHDLDPKIRRSPELAGVPPFSWARWRKPLLVGAGLVAAGLLLLQVRRNAKATVTGPRRVAALGDSITANGGYMAELQRQLPAGSVVKVFGYPGQGVGVVGSHLAEVLAWNPTDVIVACGVNDLPAQSAAEIDNITAGLQRIWNGVRASGARLVAVKVLPWAGYPTFNSYARARWAALNDWIANSGTPDVVVDAVNDLGDDQGRLQAQYNTDGLHPNAAGQKLLGQVIAAQAFVVG